MADEHLIIGGGGADDENGGARALVKDSDTRNFVRDVIEASQERPVLVDFWAEWCGPCKQLGPLLERIVREKAGKVALIKVDVDRNQELAAQLRIQSIPTVYAFYKGQPLDAFMGALPESELRRFIDNLIRLADEGTPPALEELIQEARRRLDEGAWQEAAELFQQLVQSDHESIAARGGLALAWLRLGRRDEAKALLAAIPEDKRDDVLVRQAQAALKLAEEAAEAGDVAQLEKLVAESPDDLAARLDLARALAAAGRGEEAAEHLFTILERDRDFADGEARRLLLQILEAAGDDSPFTLKARRRLSSLLFA
ncbi:MAG: thioredoxin [Alphaproteobacteria bacterium]|nr:MAG: thioredoxin [Alphaproteobacteria bacterium]